MLDYTALIDPPKIQICHSPGKTFHSPATPSRQAAFQLLSFTDASRTSCFLSQLCLSFHQRSSSSSSPLGWFLEVFEDQSQNVTSSRKPSTTSTVLPQPLPQTVFCYDYLDLYLSPHLILSSLRTRMVFVLLSVFKFFIWKTLKRK